MRPSEDSARRMCRQTIRTGILGHEVTTVPRKGWAGTKNGELLALAEKEFEAFITVDRKLATQQDLTTFNMAVVLLRARRNRLEDIRLLTPELLEKLPGATSGALTIVGT